MSTSFLVLFVDVNHQFHCHDDTNDNNKNLHTQYYESENCWNSAFVLFTAIQLDVMFTCCGSSTLKNEKDRFCFYAPLFTIKYCCQEQSQALWTVH